MSDRPTSSWLVMVFAVVYVTTLARASRLITMMPLLVNVEHRRIAASVPMSRHCSTCLQHSKRSSVNERSGYQHYLNQTECGNRLVRRPVSRP